MKDGEIVEQGPVERIFAQPSHPYTRMLLAAEPKGQALAVAPDAAAIVHATDVRVHFPIQRGLLKRVVGQVKAVDGVSLQVRAGETLGVVGESGSGKTTLGLALLRLIPSEGDIRFRDQPIQGLSWSRMRPLRRELQIVFQDPYGSLSPRMSVGDIVGEGLRIHAVGEDAADRRSRVLRILDEVGLEPSMIDRYPHEFSGGQRQRISIARAMVLQPRLVVLDEPTSALDMSVQAQIVDLLRDLQARHGLAYLFISHDLRVVRALSHQLMVLKDGVVVEAGPAERIFSTPEHPYTKALMAAAFRAEAVEGAPVAR
jgi:microcin C transport system ATP-binding protein